jgi:photosystem II stability/assembly factor-like uncharacterized protein
MIVKKKFLFIIGFFSYLGVLGQNFEIITSNEKYSSNLRAIAKNKNLFYALGSKSGFVYGLPGNLKNNYMQYAANGIINDWRSAYLRKNNDLVFINAGPPAYFCYLDHITKNINITHVDSSSGVFVDGLIFIDDMTGVAFGDPQNGKMPMWKTTDGGQNWVKYFGAEMADDEAAFAASNTSIATNFKNRILIVTGGTQSRILVSDNKGLTFSSSPLPIAQGRATQGAYSVDIWGDCIAVAGGDYSAPESSDGNFCISFDGGKNFVKAAKGPSGYKSCVKFMDKKRLIAVGTTGVDVSTDGGMNWKHVDDSPFNSIGVINKKQAILAGPEGKIAMLYITKQ